MPRAAPILVQVMPLERAVRTQPASCRSAWAPTAATRGRCARAAALSAVLSAVLGGMPQ
jgi:hypothetical protein